MLAPGNDSTIQTVDFLCVSFREPTQLVGGFLLAVIAAVLTNNALPPTRRKNRCYRDCGCRYDEGGCEAEVCVVSMTKEGLLPTLAVSVTTLPMLPIAPLSFKESYQWR